MASSADAEDDWEIIVANSDEAATQGISESANTTPDETGLFVEMSNRDAELNDATTGNKSERHTKTLENIPVGSDIDVETESGRIKSCGKISEFPASTNARTAAAKSEVGDNIQDGHSVQQGRRYVSSVGIRESLLPAVGDGDEDATDGNSRDGGGDALFYAQRYGRSEAAKLLGQGIPASDSGQTTIKGFFPAGTELDISMRGGSRVIFACKQPVNASIVSAGGRSFQFFGDQKSLSEFLGRMT